MLTLVGDMSQRATPPSPPKMSGMSASIMEITEIIMARVRTDRLKLSAAPSEKDTERAIILMTSEATRTR